MTNTHGYSCAECTETSEQKLYPESACRTFVQSSRGDFLSPLTPPYVPFCIRRFNITSRRDAHCNSQDSIQAPLLPTLFLKPHGLGKTLVQPVGIGLPNMLFFLPRLIPSFRSPHCRFFGTFHCFQIMTLSLVLK